MLLDQLDCLFEILDACCLCTVVRRGYEVIDGELIVVKERVDMLLVENASALRLW